MTNGGFSGLVRTDNQVKIRLARSVRAWEVDDMIGEYAVAYEIEATKARNYRGSPLPAMWAISPMDTFSS